MEYFVSTAESEFHGIYGNDFDSKLLNSFFSLMDPNL